MHIEVRLNNSYGKELFEPLSEDAKVICSLMKKKTFTKETLKICREAGWDIKIIVPEYKLD